MTFLLNAFVFIVIGLQLPFIVRSLSPISHYTYAAIAVSLAVIVIRIVWVYPATWLPRVLSKRVRETDPVPSWRWVAVIAWTGMRGIVSLAAALALPYRDANGLPLPGRSEILFITLCVIVATLVFQGLTLAPLISLLGIGETHQAQRQETAIRISALKAGIARLQALLESLRAPAELEVAGRLLGEYEQRVEHLEGHLDEGADGLGPENEIDHRLQQDALAAERAEISRLRDAGEIPDDVYRAIEYDLDLADLRLR